MRTRIPLPLLKAAASESAEAEGRVVELFRNRAELKKAHSALQQEMHRLTDRLKQQEGATARVQEALETLERRLASPETAYPALVFYQLRGLWQTGRRIVEQLAAELARQYEERERRLHLAENNRRLFARRAALQAQLQDAEREAADARQRAVGLTAQRARLTRFWQYFRRRRVEHALHAVGEAVAAADGRLSAARSAFDTLADEGAREFPGLSIEARRSINLAAIGCAEVLCQRLAGTPLVALARAAVSCREVTDDYGNRAGCERLMAAIAAGQRALEPRPQVPGEVRKRSDQLRAVARYRSQEDAVPTAASLDSRKDGATGVPNVLAEDTWDLFRVLLS